MEAGSSSLTQGRKRMETRLTQKVKQSRLEEKQRKDQEKKRQQKLFKPRKIIGPNDMIVNTALNKIKLEPGATLLNDVVVKTEPEFNFGDETISSTCDAVPEIRTVKYEVDIPLEDVEEDFEEEDKIMGSEIEEEISEMEDDIISLASSSDLSELENETPRARNPSQEKWLLALSRAQAGRQERIKMTPFELILESILNNKLEINYEIINWKSVCPVLKNCRLACRGWKRSVDQVLQNHPSHFSLQGPLNLKKYTGHPCPLFIFINNLGVSLDTDRRQWTIGKYLLSPQDSSENKEHSTHNPLPTRHLVISQKFYQNPPEPVRLRLFEYLKVLGKHVWYLQVCVNESRERAWVTQVTDDLFELLCHFPHLKTLSINTFRFYWHQNNLQSALDESTDWLRILECPVWEDLLVLQTDTLSPFLPFILQRNPHIQKLAVIEPDDLPHPGLPLKINLDLPSLKQLSIVITSWEQWQQLRAVPWPLKSLQLTVIRKEHDHSEIRFPDVIKGLKNFRATLQNLKLNVWERNESHRFVVGVIIGKELPNLRNLHLIRNLPSSCATSFVWEFTLSGLQCLETLQVDFHLEGDKNMGKDEEFPKHRYCDYWEGVRFPDKRY